MDTICAYTYTCVYRYVCKYVYIHTRPSNDDILTYLRLIFFTHARSRIQCFKVKSEGKKEQKSFTSCSTCSITHLTQTGAWSPSSNLNPGWITSSSQHRPIPSARKPQHTAIMTRTVVISSSRSLRAASFQVNLSQRGQPWRRFRTRENHNPLTSMRAAEASLLRNTPCLHGHYH